jgi:hypothetical protein
MDRVKGSYDSSGYHGRWADTAGKTAPIYRGKRSVRRAKNFSVSLSKCSPSSQEAARISGSLSVATVDSGLDGIIQPSDETRYVVERRVQFRVIDVHRRRHHPRFGFWIKAVKEFDLAFVQKERPGLPWFAIGKSWRHCGDRNLVLDAVSSEDDVLKGVDAHWSVLK